MIFKQIYFGRKQEKTRVDLTQNSNGQTLVFESIDWAVPSDSSCNLFVNKPDGHLVYNAGSISGNEMSFAITTQMTAVPGVAECQVQIVTNDDKILNSFVFSMAIEETIIDGTALESTDEYTALEGLITDATTAIANANDAADDARAAAGEAREPVRVGASNLIINTLNPSSTNKPKLAGASDASTYRTTASYAADGLSLTATGANAYYRFAAASLTDLYCFEPGYRYYFRCKYSGSGNFSAAAQESTSDGTSWEIVEVAAGTADISEKELVMYFDIRSYATGAYVELALASGASIKFSEIQLEKATVPSEYRPATEDITVPLLAMQSQMNGLIITDQFSVTTTSNWVVIPQSRHAGYAMVCAYTVRNDGSNWAYINRRTNDDYTILFNGVNDGTQLTIFTVWAKVG